MSFTLLILELMREFSVMMENTRSQRILKTTAKDIRTLWRSGSPFLQYDRDILFRYGKAYTSSEEEYRFRVYVHNVLEYEKEESKTPWVDYDDTPFTDMTDAELKKVIFLPYSMKKKLEILIFNWVTILFPDARLRWRFPFFRRRCPLWRQVVWKGSQAASSRLEEYRKSYSS